MHWTLLMTGFLPVALAASVPQDIDISVRDTTASKIINIHLKYPDAAFKEHVFTYGNCSSRSFSSSQLTIAHGSGGVKSSEDTRLVWVVPDDVSSGGCIMAWERNKILIGQSEPLALEGILRPKLTKRDRISMTNDSGIDAEGPWSNGVTLLKNQEIGTIDVGKAKAIGILGAGISGLMTYFLLNSVGFTNLQISESTDRVGGRIWTEYFELPDSKYQYQEMGAMRIPITATFPMGNETLTLNFSSHQIVFQLADALNELNKHDESLAVDWIPFIQDSNNALSFIENKRNADGSIPTIGDVANNSSLGAASLHTPELDKLMGQLGKIMYDPSMINLIASNLYEAHKKFMDVGRNGRGGDNWAQGSYLHNVLGFDLNTTGLAGGLASASASAPFWVSLYDNMFFSSKEWKTIDKGMSRLPNAFKPLVKDDLKYRRKIQKVEFLEHEKKVQVSWKNHYTDRQFQNTSYDYAFVAVPFTVVRKWELPEFSTILTDAIAQLGYQSACKVALEFKSRFWEHLEQPIFGHAVILGSYNQDDYGYRWVSTPEKEHAQYALDAFAQLNGDIVYGEYTGNFSRLCWLEEESNAGGSWAFPSVGQHELYIPSYFNTENNMIFIGEHTSYTHSWIASALESSVRGTVRLLLELGLVDEAKEITKTWMGRWVTV
ncbi:hypothetical protein N7537_007288 [Penicillium hordei]|uniref:Amine oxidase domain-containing protein n=1 Tax=Penicillium hordei TaxID=40994 RepID=A0AAD6DY62_9EURO|nr:uncharacterized protein N7537_007288 [Penicillium hordei]KAJ5597204.1 hypothetical protein N7537_007288 [Penicillium hordei]